MNFSAIASGVLDMLWPRRCPLCSNESDRPGRHVCSACVDRVPFMPVTGVCSVCSTPVEGASGFFTCTECAARSTKPCFDRAVSAVRYEGDIKRLVHAYKMGAQVYLRDDFAEWMHAAASARLDMAAVDFVLSVPMTLYHRIDRGFDQTAYLAEAVAKAASRKRLRGAVARTGRPKRQSGLGGSERRENVKGSFAVLRPGFVRGRTLLVVDDVMTTGSTLSECARALKEAGAAKVFALTLARTVK